MKCQYSKETKRAAMGLSQVIGFILLITSVYMYLVNPRTWFTAVGFLVMGVLLLIFAIVIWKR